MESVARYFLHETRNPFSVVRGREELAVERARQKYGLEEDYESLEELPEDIQRRMASDSDFDELGEDFDFENYGDFKQLYLELESQAENGDGLDKTGFGRLEDHQGSYDGIIGRSIDKLVRRSESVFGYLNAREGNGSDHVELDDVLEPLEGLGEVRYGTDHRQVKGNIGWRLPVETWAANVQNHVGLDAEVVGLVEDSFFWDGDDHVEAIIADNGPGIERSEIGDGDGTRIVEEIPAEYGGESYIMTVEDKEWIEREGEEEVLEELEGQLDSSLGTVFAMKMPVED